MNRLRTRFSELVSSLFEQPTTPDYLKGALFAIFIAGAVVYGEKNFPDWVEHIVMTLALFSISRLFSERPLRLLWATMGGLLGLVLVLDVALAMMS